MNDRDEAREQGMLMTTIRIATIDDAAAIARVQVDGWRATFGGIIPRAHLDSLDVGVQTSKWRRWLSEPASVAHVALDGGRVVGFTIVGPAEQGAPPGYAVEIYAIYLDAAHHRRGIGRALFDASRATTGGAALVLWSLALNPSRGFYDRLGGVVVDEKWSEVGGARVREVAYGWPALG